MRIPESGVRGAQAAKAAETDKTDSKQSGAVVGKKAEQADGAAIVSTRTAAVNRAVGKSQVDVAQKISELRRMLASDSYHIDLRSLAESIIEDELARANLGK